MNQPRDSVIAEHVGHAMRHTRLSFEAFAQDVADHYHANTRDTLRNVKFHVVPHIDPCSALRANAQIIRRMVEGVVRMPVEIEEAIVLALPAPFRDACLRELAARFGLIGAQIPRSDATGQAVQVAALLRGAGATIATLAPMFEDGLITEADATHAPAALASLDALLANITTVAAMVRKHARPADGTTPIRGHA